MERRFKKADWGSGQKVKFQSNQAPQISRNIKEFDQKPDDGLKDTNELLTLNCQQNIPEITIK